MEGVRGSIPLPPTIYIKMLARWALGLAHEMARRALSWRMRRQTWSVATRNVDILPTSRERGSKVHSQNRRRKFRECMCDSKSLNSYYLPAKASITVFRLAA